MVALFDDACVVSHPEADGELETAALWLRNDNQGWATPFMSKP